MEVKALLQVMPQRGKVEWIGLRSKKKGTIQVQDQATIDLVEGLVGDHYQGKSAKRQVTLIQAEHLEVVAAIIKKEKIAPELTRRNIVVSGINLFALKNQQFTIGEEIILETTGICHPCSRMEENLGVGGYNAMRGHGGITCRVIRGGSFRLGDSVQLKV